MISTNSSLPNFVCTFLRSFYFLVCLDRNFCLFRLLGGNHSWNGSNENNSLYNRAKNNKIRRENVVRSAMRFFVFFCSNSVEYTTVFHSSFSLSSDECCSPSCAFGLRFIVCVCVCAKLDFCLYLPEKLFIQNQSVESEITKIK